MDAKAPQLPGLGTGHIEDRGGRDDASRLIPPDPSLEQLERRAADCTACPLYRNATQTVFGDGPPDARLMLVGEQPGDVEDGQGKPFVGPAGQLLDRALAQAGIDRSRVYVTNAVKHFKWVARGKRRIHAKPGAGEIRACRPWLTAEIGLVAPAVLVCLGSTAVQSVLGPDVRVLRDRGRPIESALGPRVIVTIHPSALLRVPDEESRQVGFDRFADDLRTASKLLD